MADTYIKIWDTYESYFEPLSAAEVGRLVLAMMKYKSSGTEPELIGNERYVWPAIKRDLIKDAEYIEGKRISGKAGGESKRKQNEANASKTKLEKEKEKEKDKISSSSCDETTTTKPIEDVFRENIGKLGATGQKALAKYVERMGDELVLAVIGKCSDLGGSTWAYVRKALDEAESLGCKTADDYRRACPIGSGRNTRVTREMPSGGDWLKNATHRRPLIKKDA
nr:MAG TPA: DnaD domain protein [Caudoviricetes sp.]